MEVGQRLSHCLHDENPCKEEDEVLPCKLVFLPHKKTKESWFLLTIHSVRALHHRILQILRVVRHHSHQTCEVGQTDLNLPPIVLLLHLHRR